MILGNDYSVIGCMYGKHPRWCKLPESTGCHPVSHCSVQPLTVMFKKSYHQDKDITYIELLFDFFEWQWNSKRNYDKSMPQTLLHCNFFALTCCSWSGERKVLASCSWIVTHLLGSGVGVCALRVTEDRKTGKYRKHIQDSKILLELRFSYWNVGITTYNIHVQYFCFCSLSYWGSEQSWALRSATLSSRSPAVSDSYVSWPLMIQCWSCSFNLSKFINHRLRSPNFIHGIVKLKKIVQDLCSIFIICYSYMQYAGMFLHFLLTILAGT